MRLYLTRTLQAFEAEDLSRHGPLAASLAQISKPAYSGKEGEVLLVPGANVSARASAARNLARAPQPCGVLLLGPQEG